MTSWLRNVATPRSQFDSPYTRLSAFESLSTDKSMFNIRCTIIPSTLFVASALVVTVTIDVARSDDGQFVLPTAVAERIADLEKQIHVKRSEAANLAVELVGARRRVTDVDRRLQPLLGEIEAIEHLRDTVDGRVEKQREAAKSARAEHETHLQTVAALKRELEALQKKLDEAENKAEESATAAAKAEAEIDRLQMELAERLPKIGPLTLATVEPTKEKQTAVEQVVGLEEHLGRLDAQQRGLQHAIEDELKQAGQWISFCDQISPILYRSCLPCHNARTARGGYALHNYASLMGNGESGAAIVAGDVAGSWLVELVASGDMPVDAPPLSAEEVTLISRWIALGARLDSSADASTSLVQLMPRPAMAAAPDEYRLAPPVTAVAVDRNGATPRLASSGYREVLLWSTSGELIGRVGNVLERVYGLSFSPDGRRLAVASGTPGRLGDVSVFDVASGTILYSLVQTEDVMLDVAFSPAGDRLAAAGADGKIYIFSVDLSEVAGSAPPQAISPQRLHTIADHADWVNAIAWSSDGRKLASASRDKTAKVFDALTGRSLITFTEHEHNVVDVAFASGNEEVISADERGKALRMWRISDGKRVRELKLSRGEAIAIAQVDAEHLSVLQTGGRLVTFKTSDGKKVEEVQVATQWPSSLCVDRDGAIWFGDQSGRIHTLENPHTTTSLRSWPAHP
jgi:hypothetical protein